MATQAPTRSRIAIAVVFALSCGGAILFVWLSFGGSIPLQPQGWRFHASFDQPVTTNADVRISGVNVGKVIRSAPRNGKIDVLMNLDDRYSPLPADARAIIRTKTLLGEAYVELSPGSRAGPKLREGGTLPPSHVEPTQQLDQVLGAFDEPTRTAFKRFLADFSKALNGRSQDLNDTLGNAAPTADAVGGVVQILDDQSPALSHMIANTGVVLRAVGRRQADLRSLIAAGNQVMSVTSRRAPELTATIRALPPFMRDLRSTLLVAQATARDAAPTLRVLRPVVPLLRPALVEASVLAPDVKALFVEINPVISTALRALPQATRVVDAAQPLIDILDPAGRQLVPVVALAGRYKHELVTTLGNVGAATQATVVGPDGVRRHYLRSIVPITNELFGSYSKRLASDRHNPYFAPGGLAYVAKDGLKAFDCRNTDNPQPVPIIGPGQIPCMRQGPWDFRNQSNSFPHLRPDRP